MWWSDGVFLNRPEDHNVRIAQRNVSGRRSPGASISGVVNKETRFLNNARNHLKTGGLIVMSTMDSPIHEGAFRMDEAAQKMGFAAAAIHALDLKAYLAYIHWNTASEEPAVDGHTAFATFVSPG